MVPVRGGRGTGPDLFPPSALPERGLALIRCQIEAVLAILLEYRFFFPDQTAILRRDERVMTAFRGLQTDVIAAISIELAAATAHSSVPPPEPQALARSLWLVVTGWVTFLLAQGRQIDRDSVHEVLEIALALVRPFIIEPRR
ncbi:TetR/AcrR family transcriptional regulator [Oleomonas cavernae]|uniref:TetR/AcrR family transcriptional regulator n=1 Tax=Oleomonas cavernae TaxID=2320859 RepID=UPI001314848F|nr:TetR/AcrR family transcriptional regulator [Oleomonas cavernae]